MGNVEYDNTLRLAPNAYQVDTDFWAGGGYGNGAGPDLRHRARGDAGQPHRQHRHQHADAGFVHVAEDAQLQRLVRAADPWNQVVEASYVGTRGRDLVSREQRQRHAVRRRSTPAPSTASTCQCRSTASPSRASATNLASFRPFNALSGITLYDFRGVSNYDSMQVTLSRQTGRRLQYFVAYTLGRDPAARSAASTSIIDPYDPTRTYGVLGEDRTHILNVSWNAFLPDGAKGKMDNPIGRGVLNGWQLSGISSLASGIPIRPSFSGDAASAAIAAAYFGTADVVGPSNSTAATASRRCIPATRRTGGTRSARRCSTSTASRCRRSARTATWCRRTTSGRRRASTTT